MNEEVIGLINDGLKLKDISESTGVAYSTVRKLASISNFINTCSYLNEEHIEKIKKLGLNAVVLIPLKDQKNNLVDLLEWIDPSNVTRAQLLDAIKNLSDINNSKTLLENNYDREMEELDSCIASINKKLDTLIKSKDRLRSEFKYIADIKKEKPDVFRAYLQLIGIVNNKYCLAKRVNISLWNRLRRSNIISTDSEYIDGRSITISYICNMRDFVENTINAFKVNNYFKFESQIKGVSPIKYITIDKQIEPIISKLKAEIDECEAKKQQCKEEVLKASKKAINNYFEHRDFKNKFFTKDTVTHSKIAKGGLKWLVNNNYIGTIELKSGKYLFDVAAYNDGEVIILEAKASASDLMADDKLTNYSNYCDKLYIISNDEYVCHKAMDIYKDIGVIQLNSSFKYYKTLREANYVGNGNDEIRKAINLKNSKLLVMTF